MKINRELQAAKAPSLAAITALGVVYGDLGTSPLYTIQTVLSALGGLTPAQSALGILSLIFWTLLITISVKYCIFVMRADNQGEGGILALMSLVGMNDWRRGTFVGATMGLLGAALIYGDGIITPAISVLSALEGVTVATSALKPLVLPLATAILIGLFAVQRFGTAAIGRAFGPIMLVWFAVIGIMGLLGIIQHPAVIAAINPIYAVRLLVASGSGSLLLLGGIFLCATGGEALYADMGHIGRFPIRLAWFAVVLPGVLLSYAGQAALLLDGKVATSANPFWLLAPGWALVPLVVLATLATIIASQAIITGAFSMTRQAMQLGWLPPFNIRQTSDRMYGQIYVPAVNFMMAVGTLAVTVGFGSAERLAGAFGTAVSTTMVLTTFLLFQAMHRVWRWPLAAVAALAGLFFVVDVGFFIANLAKVVDGGWVPLTLGATIYAIMLCWRTGLQKLRSKRAAMGEAPERFYAELNDQRVARVPGTAVFLIRADDLIPAYITEYVRNTGSLHETVLALHVLFEETPRINEGRCATTPMESGLIRVTLRYGFVEQPDLAAALREVPGLPEKVALDRAVFFGTRDHVVVGRHSIITQWRYGLFAFLFRNAVRITDRFNLPPARTVEIARQVEL